jgi:hypothetical protein
VNHQRNVYLYSFYLFILLVTQFGKSLKEPRCDWQPEERLDCRSKTTEALLPTTDSSMPQNIHNSPNKLRCLRKPNRHNAKKRSAAAFISAQNGTFCSHVLTCYLLHNCFLLSVWYSQHFLDAAQQAKRDQSISLASGGRYSLAISRFLYLQQVQAPAQDLGVTLMPELQFACCMSNRYRPDAFPRCVSCTRRWAGDTCRFQGIRYFMHNADGKLLGISFCESSSISPPPTMEFLKKWNRKVGTGWKGACTPFKGTFFTPILLFEISSDFPVVLAVDREGSSADFAVRAGPFEGCRNCSKTT